MASSHSNTGLRLVLFLLLAASLAYQQGLWQWPAFCGRLSEAQLAERIRAGTSDRQLQERIETCGITFTPPTDTLLRLREGGASAVTLFTVRRARAHAPGSGRATARCQDGSFAYQEAPTTECAHKGGIADILTR